jgi:UDP:flavonoid glycosyltransferase YjiC (YdhE family)
MAWELGGDYGHLMRFLTLGREFLRRGHEPLLALRELTHFDAVLGDEAFRVFQAPIFVANVKGLPPSIGFAETLMRLGFIYPGTLTALCHAWRNLVEAIAPKLMLFDYAPTGLLATRGLAIPRVAFGSSFSLPPRTQPMPIYRWWRGEPLERVLASERIVLATANQVLARLALPPMAVLSDLLDVEDTIITISEEFDQYPGRTGARYWGTLANVDKGVPPPWPMAERKRVFAYLKPHYDEFEKVLNALRKVDAAVVVHAPGVSDVIVSKYTSANVAFSAQPVRMADVAAQCHAAICHAGGTVEALMTAGKPVLLLPQHLEQMMTAKRAVTTGAALIADPAEPSSRNYERALGRLLNEPGFTAAAEAIAARHLDDDPRERAARVADRCEEIMAGYQPPTRSKQHPSP